MEIFIRQNKVSINDIKHFKGNLILFALVIIGLVVIFSYSMGNVAAASNTVYVNASSGSDSYDGSSPVHTTGLIGPNLDINTGIINVNSGGTLKIAKGIYTGTKNYGITINKNLTIIGQNTTNTIINAAKNDRIFFITKGSTVNISNITFTQGKTSAGGSVIGNAGGNLILKDCNFNSNTATGNGGVIGNTGSLTVKECNFNNNTASEDGGAIYNGGTCTVTSSTFTSNIAINGSAIYSGNKAILNISGSTFTGNQASNNGGAIYNGYNSTVTSSTFKNNIAIINGGAIYTDVFCVINVTSSTFTGNKAYSGGAIYNDMVDTSTISSCTFTSNQANSFDGGAISDQSFILNVMACSFTGNTAQKSYGGAISSSGGTNKITSCTFTNNNAISGGAIMDLDKSTLINNIFTNNKADVGGAIENGGNSLILIRSTFSNNSAIDGGGAIFNNFGNVIIQFNRIIGNTAKQGTAIYNNGATIDATLNWWGDNKGPNGKIIGLTVNKWLVLTIKASSYSIPNNGYSKITTDLIHDNTGALQTGGYVSDGIPIHFTTTLGAIMSLPWTTSYGISQAYLYAGTAHGTAIVYAKLDNQTMQTTVKILDTIPPKVSTTTPTNLKTGVSRTSTTTIKFSENIKTSTYFSNITIKNLSTGKYLTLSRTISGNTLNIKTATKNANTWYQVIIPAKAIKDYTGNNLQATYTFKFKTGT